MDRSSHPRGCADCLPSRWRRCTSGMHSCRRRARSQPRTGHIPLSGSRRDLGRCSQDTSRHRHCTSPLHTRCTRCDHLLGRCLLCTPLCTCHRCQHDRRGRPHTHLTGCSAACRPRTASTDLLCPQSPPDTANTIREQRWVLSLPHKPSTRLRRSGIPAGSAHTSSARALLAPRRRCTPCSSHHQVSACPRRTCRNHQAWHLTDSQVSTPRKRSEPARCCSRRCGGVCHSRRGCSGLHRLRTSPHWAHHHGRSRCTHVHLTRSHPEDTPHSSCSPAVLCLPDTRCTQCRSSRPSLVID